MKVFTITSTRVQNTIGKKYKCTKVPVYKKQRWGACKSNIKQEYKSKWVKVYKSTWEKE